MQETQQLNIQMPGTDAVLTPLQKLNLMDDFLFDVATVDLEACKIILELSLGITIRSIAWKEGQKVIHNLPGKRGIRMDFYVEDEQGRIFDVEMQKRNEGNIPKRTRFYQALIDAPMLKSGEKGFDHLNPSYIIVICGFDLYGLGKYQYTFENRCSEATDLTLGDGCKKIMLNTRGTNDDDVEQSLIDFLHYIEHSDDDNVPSGCDERLRHLHKKIQDIKSNEQMGVTYMKMEERDRLIREEGKTAGMAEGLSEGISQGVSQGREFGINVLLKTCREVGLTREQTFAKILNEFSLSEDDAESDMQKYWDAESTSE